MGIWTGSLLLTILYFIFRPNQWLGLATAGFFVFMTHRTLGDNKKTLRLYPWQIALAIILGYLVTANLYNLFLWQDFHQTDFITTQYYLVKNLVLNWLGLMLIAAAAYGSGRRVLNKLKLLARENKTNLESTVLSLALGLALLSYLAFGLAFLEQFQLAPALTVLVGLVVLSRQEIKQFLSTFFTQQITLEISRRNHFLLIPVSLGLLLAIALTFHLAGVPIEYDGNSRYLNTALLVADSGRLWDYTSTAILPYNLELINAYGVLLGGLSLGMLVNSLIGFLALSMVFVLARKFFNSQSAYLSVAALLAAPMTTFFLAVDGKTDQGLLLFASLTVYFFLGWAQKQQAKLLALTGLFLGFSLGVKYTAVFLIAGIAAAMNFWLFRQRRVKSKKAIRTLIAANLVLALFSLLAFSPWVFRHLTASGPSRRYPGYQHILRPEPQLVMAPIDLGLAQQISQAIHQRDFGSYVRGYGLRDRVFHLWDIFKGRVSNYRSGHASLGAIYFLLITLWIYLTISRRLRLSAAGKILAVLLAIYFLIWYKMAFEISWYAYPGLGLLGILAGSALEKSLLLKSTRRRISQLIVFLALAQVFFTFFFHSVYFLIPEIGPRRLAENRSARPKVYPPLVDLWEISQATNQVLENNPVGKVFMPDYHLANIPALYIHENDRRLVRNNEYLFNQKLTDQEIFRIFNNLQIEYLLRTEYLDWWYDSVKLGGTTPIGQIQRQRQEKFLNQYGQLIFKNKHFGLYSIAK